MILYLILGIGINLIFKNLPIPSPYKDINYSFPLYINLFCLVYRLFDYWFLDLSEFYYRKRTDDDWEKLRF